MLKSLVAACGPRVAATVDVPARTATRIEEYRYRLEIPLPPVPTP